MVVCSDVSRGFHITRRFVQSVDMSIFHQTNYFRGVNVGISYISLIFVI
jgi:hypothetical protein